MTRNVQTVFGTAAPRQVAARETSEPKKSELDSLSGPVQPFDPLTTEASNPGSCAWCGRAFAPNTLGRPRRYCSTDCRTAAGHHREDAPGLRARIAEMEEAERSWQRVGAPFPAAFRAELDALRRSLAVPPEAR